VKLKVLIPDVFLAPLNRVRIVPAPAVGTSPSAGANKLEVDGHADAFTQHWQLFRQLWCIAEDARKEAGDIKKVAGDKYIDNVAFELYCYMAMSGLIWGVRDVAAQLIVREMMNSQPEVTAMRQ
jgi:hypothetical protein